VLGTVVPAQEGRFFSNKLVGAAVLLRATMGMFVKMPVPHAFWGLYSV